MNNPSLITHIAPDRYITRPFLATNAFGYNNKYYINNGITVGDNIAYGKIMHTVCRKVDTIVTDYCYVLFFIYFNLILI